MRERLVEITQNLAPTPIAWFAIIVGVFVHFAGFFLFKIQVPGLWETESPEAYISYVSLDGSNGSKDLRDKALLSDSVPLFLPSKLDYGWEQLQPGYYLNSQHSDMLEAYQYEVNLEAGEVLEQNYSSVPDSEVTDLLSNSLWNPFRTLGERSVKPHALSKRFGVFEFQIESSRKPIQQFLIENSPLNEDIGSIFWRPVEVLVYVGVEGSLGAPFLRETSGILALDTFVVNEVRRLANKQIVPPGYYRVVFGP